MKSRQNLNTLQFALSVAIVALLCGGAIGSATHFQSQSNSASTAAAASTQTDLLLDLQRLREFAHE